VDEMNFAYGVIVIVGVLAAISVGFIVISPDDVIKPRITIEENPTVCTMDYTPVCGVDGTTYGNLCMLNASDIKLDYSGECLVPPVETKPISVNSDIMPKITTVGDILLIEVEFRDDDGNIVDHVNYDITAIQDTETILSDPDSHRHPGKHPVHETTALSASSVEIKVIVQGLGHGDDITEPKGIESSMTFVPEIIVEETPVMEVPAPGVTDVEEMIVEESPQEVTKELSISIPNGVGVTGCDETDECYLPYDATVSIGGTVTWSNDDTAPHTVTSGTIDVLTGLFDSGLFMAGTTFEFTFDEAGTYDYLCMVHPWMTGIINVS
jgi:plastocyanin